MEINKELKEKLLGTFDKVTIEKIKKHLKDVEKFYNASENFLDLEDYSSYCLKYVDLYIKLAYFSDESYLSLAEYWKKQYLLIEEFNNFCEKECKDNDQQKHIKIKPLNESIDDQISLNYLDDNVDKKIYGNFHKINSNQNKIVHTEKNIEYKPKDLIVSSIVGNKPAELALNKIDISQDQNKLKEYNFTNHPDHYNIYDYEVIDMMEKIWGPEDTMKWCKMTAWKYRQRMGTKPGESVERDLEKEKWYLNKVKELKEKIK